MSLLRVNRVRFCRVRDISGYRLTAEGLSDIVAAAGRPPRPTGSLYQCRALANGRCKQR